jgi:hypothetical protein
VPGLASAPQSSGANGPPSNGLPSAGTATNGPRGANETLSTRQPGDERH